MHRIHDLIKMYNVKAIYHLLLPSTEVQDLKKIHFELLTFYHINLHYWFWVKNYLPPIFCNRSMMSAPARKSAIENSYDFVQP